MRIVAVALLAGALWTGCAGGEEVMTPPPVPVEADPKPAPPPAPAKVEALKLPEGANPAMIDPSLANKTAPDTYKVKFETSKGDFVVEVHRDWSPQGADRVFNMVDIGYFTDVRFFRVVDNFMAQFGISGYPEVNAVWRDANIDDDPVTQSNTKGMVTFAKSGAPNSRSTQLFINYKDNSMLDRQGFSPFGKVVEGMEVVEALNSEFGDGPPHGKGPNQMKLQTGGNAFLLSSGFEALDYIKSASIVE